MSIQKKIKTKVKEIEEISNLLPCICVINNISDGAPVWMCKKGLKALDITLEELEKLSAQEYYSRFFNEEDAKDNTPKILTLLEKNNDDESVTFFQQVRVNFKEDWTWHITSTKILLRDDAGAPILLFSLSMPIDEMHTMAQKASRLLEENNFLRKNFHQFSKLTDREVEVLRHLAMGKSSSESGVLLFISSKTVDTHKKNIKKKLNTNSFYELTQYARSFDLI